MKKLILPFTAALIVALGAFFLWSHFRQSKVSGSWSASSGASVQFSRAGTVTIHPPSVAAGGSPSAAPVTSGNYKILDASHLQITVSGFDPVIAEYSVSGDTLKLTTPDDGFMVYTRAGR